MVMNPRWIILSAGEFVWRLGTQAMDISAFPEKSIQKRDAGLCRQGGIIMLGSAGFVPAIRAARKGLVNM